MEKNFQAGWYYNERTDMKERLYRNACQIMIGSDYCTISKKLSSKFEEMDNVYVDKRGAFVVGFGDDSLNRVTDESI